MAGRQDVSFTKTNIIELVNRLDPKRLSEPQAVYVMSNGRIKYEIPDQPGEEYRWVRDLPDE